MSRGYQNPEPRFWKKVNQDGPIPTHRPELGKCWLWLGSKRKHGHGYFMVGRIATTPYHFSYKLHKGEIPNGHYVLHHCDNGACVNPEHLFTGTQKDNMRDKVEKGRQCKGEPVSIRTRGSENGCAVITDDDVIAMRAMRNQTPRPTVLEVSKHFTQVSPGTVKAILNGRSWKHLPK